MSFSSHRRRVGMVVAAAIATLATLVAVSHRAGAAATNGAAPRLVAPAGVAVDRRGFWYVTDFATGRLSKFSPDGAYVSTPAHFHAVGGKFPCGPAGAVIGPEGHLYVADQCDGTVDVLSTAGRVLRRYQDPGGGFLAAVDPHGGLIVNMSAGAGVGRIASDGSGPKFLHSFGSGNPVGAAVRRNADVLVALDQGDRVEEMSPAGTVVARSAAFGAGWPASQASVVAVAPSGDVYAAAGPDSIHQAVFRLTPALRILGTVVRRGSGPNEVQFPGQIAVDAQGNLYLTDPAHRRVLKLSASGRLLATAR